MDVWESGELFEREVEGETREKALAYLSDPSYEPPEPNYAATVMVVRDATPETKEDAPSRGSEGVEVFMLRRAKTMAFVPKAIVFPGGRVDDRDSDPRLPWIGPSPSEWAARMDCSEEVARCVVVAAAREVFEECGVLLAGVDESNVVNDLTDAKWDDAREALATHTLSFAEILIEEGLALRSDLLGIRSRWLTPEFESRRYDTFFFAALLPEGQVPDDRTSEATIADWVDPQWLFSQSDQGRLLLLPPTRYNLSRIAQAKSAREFVKDAPKVKRVMLSPRQKEDGTVVLQCLLP